jgi:hypothetical protein
MKAGIAFYVQGDELGPRYAVISELHASWRSYMCGAVTAKRARAVVKELVDLARDAVEQPEGTER